MKLLKTTYCFKNTPIKLQLLKLLQGPLYGRPLMKDEFAGRSGG